MCFFRRSSYCFIATKVLLIIEINKIANEVSTLTKAIYQELLQKYINILIYIYIHWHTHIDTPTYIYSPSSLFTHHL